ncbi:MAG: sigma-70 family RNA polymerase sigma factor [Kofleriaceae bacterium]
MRALARSLVHGDPDAEDLIQDAAAATLEHAPTDDRPIRPWLIRVLINRRRMDVRSAARRKARELALAPIETSALEARPDAALDRARALERLAAALSALDEPFRDTVIRRYLDGQSAAAIGRALGVPAATIRWRLNTGLDRLRAALEATSPDWRRALIPFAPIGVAVKTKTSVIALVVLVLVLIGGAVLFGLRSERTASVVANPSSVTGAAKSPRKLAPGQLEPTAAEIVSPGQSKPIIEIVDRAGGVVSGRVINWSTGDGVEGAELTFGNDGQVTTVLSRNDGSFELAPPAPGELTLTAISAAGFLPYAPELLHSNIRVALAKDRAVRGLTVFLFPAVDYHGRVVDGKGAPVAGARVRLLGTPAGEQTIEKLDTEWTTGKDGRFTFHAADDAVFEAVRGSQRGWARLDGNVAITHQLVIQIADVPARTATITGRVVDANGQPLTDVLVRAMPDGDEKAPRAVAFATTSDDGEFFLDQLDDGEYSLAAQSESLAPAVQRGVRGGARDVKLIMDGGAKLVGAVVDSTDHPAGAFTLLVYRRVGAAREMIVARSFVDPRGKFEVHVPAGDYEVIAAAAGWAPSSPVSATATIGSSTTSLRIAVTTGATLRGRVVASDDAAGLKYARVMREAPGGGASPQPANAGTVTRADGSFELTGIPPGPLSVTVAAGGFHPKVEAGMTASDGATLGPITIALTRLGEGETPSLELVGIGVKLAADGDALRVDGVFEGGGAHAAGIVMGDRIIAVDGVSVTKLGVDGSVAKIRGTIGTTVQITLSRDGKPLPLVVERRKMRA